MMKRFDIGLIWRLLLLFGCMSGLAAVFWNANFPFTQLLLAAACIGLILVASMPSRGISETADRPSQ